MTILSVSKGFKLPLLIASLKLFASKITDGNANFSSSSIIHCLRKLAGTIINILRFFSAHLCAIRIPASIVLPSPTSSASSAPFEKGDLNANTAASTWCGFKSMREPMRAAAIRSIVPMGARRVSSFAKSCEW